MQYVGLGTTKIYFSRISYAAGAWMSGVSATTLESEEVAQRQACHTTTGCLKSTPVGALTRETDLQHQKTAPCGDGCGETR